jgi:hypothetical protein
MGDALRHNINLVTPGLNFWGDQNDASKSVVDKTKWIMQTAADRIEKLESALRWIIEQERQTAHPTVCAIVKTARKALEAEDD